MTQQCSDTTPTSRVLSTCSPRHPLTADRRPSSPCGLGLMTCPLAHRRRPPPASQPPRLSGLACMPPPVLFPAVPTHRSANSLSRPNRLDDMKRRASPATRGRHLSIARLVRRGAVSRGPTRPEALDRVAVWNVFGYDDERKCRLTVAPIGRVNIIFQITDRGKTSVCTPLSDATSR